MTDPTQLEEAARKTYGYLRVAVVAMAVLLGTSVAIEIVFGPRGGILDSISAYYYTPVRGVFVGSLLAVGLGLVAIKGREGWEDSMLNLAGMLAPLVALVPTPISVPVAGFEVERRTVPAELVPAVENNVAALLVLGVVGLVFAAATVQDGPYRSAHLRGVAGAGVLLVGLAVWFGFGRESFLEYGHYAAAVPMFGLIVGVAVVNARQTRSGAVMSRLAAATYRRAYAAIAGGDGRHHRGGCRFLRAGRGAPVAILGRGRPARAIRGLLGVPDGRELERGSPGGRGVAPGWASESLPSHDPWSADSDAQRFSDAGEQPGPSRFHAHGSLEGPGHSPGGRLSVRVAEHPRAVALTEP